MKIAIFSDIHANIDALESVLNDIKQENCSKIFFLGDIVLAGPEPIKTLHRIQELSKSEDFYIVQGNTDKMLSVFSFETQNEILKTNAVMASAYYSDSQILSPDDKKYLAELPVQQKLELFGIKILLVHGSPRSNNENIYPDMLIEEIEEIIKDTDADIIFCGHTHIPCGYQTNSEKTVVNVGSVGRPFSESPDSCYAVMEIDEQTSKYEVKHKFVKYDVEKAAQKIRERDFEGCDKLAKMLMKATSRYPQ